MYSTFYEHLIDSKNIVFLLLKKLFASLVGSKIQDLRPSVKMTTLTPLAALSKPVMAVSKINGGPFIPHLERVKC